MEKEKLGWEPAFPIQTLQYRDGFQPGEIDQTYFGMSIRLKIAAMAMQSMIANPGIKRPDERDKEFEEQKVNFSRIAFEYADALLEQENK